MTEYKLITLKNGLRLLLVPRKSTEIVTIMAMFKVGSRQESNEIAGISHVLEHMHFKGTKKRPTSFDIAEFIESIGGQHNAFTGKEYTGYYTKIMPKHIEDGFDFLSDQLLNSKIDEAELEKEKQVIIQEINMYQDLPMEMVDSYFEKVAFGDNALGRDIIGFKKSVADTTREKLLDYKDKYYQAKNAVIVLAGNFGQYSEEKIAKLAEKYFSFGNDAVEETSKIELNDKAGHFFETKKTEQTHLVIGFKTVSLNHPDFFKIEVLATIIGGSMSSRMWQEVRAKRGLAYNVRTSTSVYSESGVIMTQAGVEHEKLYEASEAIIDQYKKIKAEVVPEAELNKAKEIILGRMLNKIENSEEVAYHFASDALLADEILTYDQIRKIYQKVSADDIMEMAKKYLLDEKICIAVIGPKIDEDKLLKIVNKEK